jgi:putative SOS response-associated peptidase YedK
MCNHYRNIPGGQEALSTWREYIGWDIKRPLPPELQSVADDVWPKRNAMVVRSDDGGAFVDVMQWGVPLTMQGKREGSTVTKHITNVRNLQSPFWRSTLAAASQRCLVPFTAFAEPLAGQGRAEAWFGLSGERIGAFAGLWRRHDGCNVFAFLTCEPNPLIAPIHPKAMPVILQPENYNAWLDGAEAQSLAHPFPSQLMTRMA